MGADKAVKESEPGMLHHTFDQDPTDPLAFTWSEVYKDDASLLFHLTNPPLVKFVEQHGEMGGGVRRAPLPRQVLRHQVRLLARGVRPTLYEIVELGFGMAPRRVCGRVTAPRGGEREYS